MGNTDLVESATNSAGLSKAFDAESVRLVSTLKTGKLRTDRSAGAVAMPDVATPGFMATMSSEKPTSIIKVTVVGIAHKTMKPVFQNGFVIQQRTNVTNNILRTKSIF